MKNVEQSHFGYQWAEHLCKEGLEVKRRGSELHIAGILPQYRDANEASDLIREFTISAKYRAVGRARTTEPSPDIRFANADTDEKLIAFVQRFGPVVAKCAYINAEKPEAGRLAPRMPLRLFAVQDLQELRNEQAIYRCALALVQMAKSNCDHSSLRGLIGKISTRISDWPRQWKREKSQCKRQPLWNLSVQSLKRIKELVNALPDAWLPPSLDSRIVVCELVNSFRPVVFPNPLEMHSSIKYGIRPLLYSLLRRQLLAPRELATCANTQCRNFFNIERSGQQFCDAECSIHQRQRTYWTKRGRKLRKKRLRDRNKAKN
jgi:hypothetical protein